MQRGAVLILGLIAAIGYLTNPKNLKTFKGFLLASYVALFAGIGLSLRQLYLQSLPAVISA